MRVANTALRILQWKTLNGFTKQITKSGHCVTLWNKGKYDDPNKLRGLIRSPITEMDYRGLERVQTSQEWLENDVKNRFVIAHWWFVIENKEYSRAESDAIGLGLEVGGGEERTWEEKRYRTSGKGENKWAERTSDERTQNAFTWVSAIIILLRDLNREGKQVRS